MQKARSETPDLENGKVLVILGDKDPIIVEDELVEDATEALGPDNVRFEVCDAGHELVVTDSENIIGMIWKFWGQGPGPSITEF